MNDKGTDAQQVALAALISAAEEMVRGATFRHGTTLVELESAIEKARAALVTARAPLKMIAVEDVMEAALRDGTGPEFRAWLEKYR